ncbi:DNA-directed RNA polymerase I subunit RPA1-like [Convolutriloba macropyga]|uniref:DNA-directed RNA polymerase I subunit RPA1-like n=1 Tax=Convolutriloba macropyga TaxID=536237 RepID=UPI003F51EABC
MRGKESSTGGNSKWLHGLPEVRLEKCHLGVMTSEEVMEMSVLSITNTQAFDPLGTPSVDGLYDRRLGTVEVGVNCQTCGQSWAQCMGHMGHIELPCPVYNPLYFKDTLRLLQTICRRCTMLNIPNEQSDFFIAQMQLIYSGKLREMDELIQESKQYNDMEQFGVFIKEYKSKSSQNDLLEELTTSIIDVRADTVKKFYDDFFRKTLKRCCHCQSYIPVYRSERTLQILSSVRKGQKSLYHNRR